MKYEDGIKKETHDIKIAIESLNEEMEAVNAYNQRADVCKDANLRKILLHNSDEEKEHAAMLLEWLRQKDKNLNKELKEYLFKGKVDTKH